MHLVKYRRPLNKDQIHLINLFYKFRYINTRQLSEYLGKNPRIINGRLKILLDQGYIDRFYDKSYKLKGKPAIYYLLPKSLSFLKTQPYFNNYAKFIHYRNKASSNAQINHYIKVFDIYQELKDKYKYDKFITKIELARKLELNEILPDLLIIKPNKQKSAVIYVSNVIKNKNINVYIQNTIDSNDFMKLVIYYSNYRMKNILQNIKDQFIKIESVNLID